MTPFAMAVLGALLYVALLFGIAFHADSHQTYVGNAQIYTLSLAGLLSTWAFYGSAGGLCIIPFTLGCSLSCAVWGTLLRRMARLAHDEKLTSLADFLAGRYGSSPSVGGVATLICAVGLMPCIAIQLRAIIHSLHLITSPLSHSGGPLLFHHESGLVIALLLGLFCVRFGARHLDASEQHAGFAAALAASTVVTFAALGILALFALLHFPHTSPPAAPLTLPASPQWAALMVLGALTVFCLPGQFHVSIVENRNCRQISCAMWMFPALLLLFTVLLLPVTLAGHALPEAQSKDYLALLLPLSQNASTVMLATFLGGLAAATGMVLSSVLTLSTMILNHVLVPLVLHFRGSEQSLSELLVRAKRGVILAIVVGSALLDLLLTRALDLTTIALLSFAALAQLAPALLGGMFWKKATKHGVIVGAIMGLVVWGVTLLMPALDASRHLPPDANGVTGLVDWSHGLFWSLFVNASLFVGLSWRDRLSSAERRQARHFVTEASARQAQTLSDAPSARDFAALMAKFIGKERTSAAFAEYLHCLPSNPSPEEEITILREFTEKTLSGSVGSAAARAIVTNYLSAHGSRMENILDIFAHVSLCRDASREQLAVLYETARRVARGGSALTIFNDILQMLDQQFPLDICLIRMLDPEHDLLTVQARAGLTGKAYTTAPVGLHDARPTAEVFRNQRMAVYNNLPETNPEKYAVFLKEGVQSMAHMPISAGGETAGVLSAFSLTSRNIFTDEFMEFFGSVADLAGAAWHNAEQTRQLVKAREQQRELEIAKQIQRNLLPDKLPEIPGISLAGRCETAHHLGGDYYDVLYNEDSATADIIIADVSGHNVGAALFMPQIRTFIRALARYFTGPAHLLATMNHFFHRDLSQSEHFITMFCLRLDVRTKRFRYASAGHNPPLLFRASRGKCDPLDADGLILGVLEDVEFAEKEDELAPGDLLLLYTDGIVEASNAEREMFGEPRLRIFLRNHHRDPLDELVPHLMNAVRRFGETNTFEDDATVVAITTNT